MKIALSSDEWLSVHKYILEWLHQRGHEALTFGSFTSQKDESWVDSTMQAVESVADGTCDKGVVCCWSGVTTTGGAAAAAG